MNKTLIQRTLVTDNRLTAPALRLSAGAIFIAHGAQKLFGSFGGYGLEGTGQWMASIGLEPGYLMALGAGSAEFFGGIALILGLLTRPAAVMLALTMVVAVVAVHLQNGFFLSNNGYEFGLALFGMSVALAFSGGGAFSLDRKLSAALNDGSVESDRFSAMGSGA